MANTKVILNRFAGTVGIEQTVEDLQQLFDVPCVQPIAADAAASTNTANAKLWSNPFDYPVVLVSAKVNPSSIVTTNATDYATYTLYRDDGANTAQVACAAVASNAASWAEDIAQAFTLTPANCVVAAGANVFRTVLKSGNGVQLPIHTLALRFRRA
jgi:hypothetical protein